MPTLQENIQGTLDTIAEAERHLRYARSYTAEAAEWRRRAVHKRYGTTSADLRHIEALLSQARKAMLDAATTIGQ